MTRAKLIIIEGVCPEVGKCPGCADYAKGLFCLRCPDRDKIPAGCDLRCGWPDYIMRDVCPYQDECPCARPPSGERAEALCRFYANGTPEDKSWGMELLNRPPTYVCRQW